MPALNWLGLWLNVLCRQNLHWESESIYYFVTWNKNQIISLTVVISKETKREMFKKMKTDVKENYLEQQFLNIPHLFSAFSYNYAPYIFRTFVTVFEIETITFLTNLIMLKFFLKVYSILHI